MPSILHLIASLEGGGAERQLAMLASEQARRGWDVQLGLRRSGVYAKLLDDRVHVHPLGDHAAGHPLLFASVARLVRKLRPEIVQTWLPQMDIVGGTIVLAQRIPWVLSERASAASYPPRRASTILRRLLGRRADAIVANSRAGASQWPRAEVIANAVDLAAIAAAPPLPPSVAVWAGRHVPDKAPEIFVAAARTLAITPLIFGQPFSETWWGHLKTAQMLVSTSRAEGQPNAVLEAMAARCPLIVTDIAAHREILDDDCALFVRPDRVDDVVRAMRAILAAPEAAAARAMRARERVAAHTIAHATDAYEQVYAIARTRSAAR